jgi:transposase
MDAEKLIKDVRFKGMSPDEKKFVIKYLLSKNLSAYDIALHLKVTPQLIYYWIKKKINND